MRNGIKIEYEAGTKTRGYIRISIDNKIYFAHRLAWLFVYGNFPKYNIDHINRIRDDNRIENLREATQSYNVINSKTSINNTSGIRGISYHKTTRKWYARIGILRKQRYLGTYDNMLDAAKARFKAEQENRYQDHLSELSDAYNHILKHDPSFILEYDPNDEQTKRCLKAIKDMTSF